MSPLRRRHLRTPGPAPCPTTNSTPFSTLFYSRNRLYSPNQFAVLPRRLLTAAFRGGCKKCAPFFDEFLPARAGSFSKQNDLHPATLPTPVETLGSCDAAN